MKDYIDNFFFKVYRAASQEVMGAPRLRTAYTFAILQYFILHEFIVLFYILLGQLPPRYGPLLFAVILLILILTGVNFLYYNNQRLQQLEDKWWDEWRGKRRKETMRRFIKITAVVSSIVILYCLSIYFFFIKPYLK